MQILFVAAEAVPFAKTGGLADVMGSLPLALRELGAGVGVIIPGYLDIPERFRANAKPFRDIEVRVGWRLQRCTLSRFEYEDVPFYFAGNPYYFERHGMYGFYDEAERYAFFCRAVLDALPHLDLMPDILHCNDWHTGMVPVLLKAHYAGSPLHERLKTVFTIHNLAYQGVFSSDILRDLLGLDERYLSVDCLEFHGGVSFMKGGLAYSDVITTVSKTYASEIQTPDYGEGLDGLLRKRAKDLYGIVNGIDYMIHDPMTDRHIPSHYRYSLPKKRKNRNALRATVGLSPPLVDTPIIGLVSRLTEQKGLDLVGRVLRAILDLDLQMVVLGTGEPRYESMFASAASERPGKLSSRLLFDDELAHLIYAGSDMFLMPSRFEPCGISQLIALRYGTIPIVRETGGLKDTVEPFNEYTGKGTGFSFRDYDAQDLLHTVAHALRLYRDQESWRRLVMNAVAADYGWSRSARRYLKLYQDLLSSG